MSDDARVSTPPGQRIWNSSLQVNASAGSKFKHAALSSNPNDEAVQKMNERFSPWDTLANRCSPWGPSVNHYSSHDPPANRYSSGDALLVANHLSPGDASANRYSSGDALLVSNHVSPGDASSNRFSYRDALSNHYTSQGSPEIRYDHPRPESRWWFQRESALVGGGESGGRKKRMVKPCPVRLLQEMSKDRTAAVQRINCDQLPTSHNRQRFLQPKTYHNHLFENEHQKPGGSTTAQMKCVQSYDPQQGQTVWLLEPSTFEKKHQWRGSSVTEPLRSCERLGSRERQRSRRNMNGAAMRTFCRRRKEHRPQQKHSYRKARVQPILTPRVQPLLMQDKTPVVQTFGDVGNEADYDKAADDLSRWPSCHNDDAIIDDVNNDNSIIDDLGSLDLSENNAINDVVKDNNFRGEDINNHPSKNENSDSLQCGNTFYNDIIEFLPHCNVRMLREQTAAHNSARIEQTEAHNSARIEQTAAHNSARMERRASLKGRGRVCTKHGATDKTVLGDNKNIRICTEKVLEFDKSCNKTEQYRCRPGVGANVQETVKDEEVDVDDTSGLLEKMGVEPKIAEVKDMGDDDVEGDVEAMNMNASYMNTSTRRVRVNNSPRDTSENNDTYFSHFNYDEISHFFNKEPVTPPKFPYPKRTTNKIMSFYEFRKLTKPKFRSSLLQSESEMNPAILCVTSRGSGDVTHADVIASLEEQGGVKVAWLQFQPVYLKYVIPDYEATQPNSCRWQFALTSSSAPGRLLYQGVVLQQGGRRLQVRPLDEQLDDDYDAYLQAHARRSHKPFTRQLTVPRHRIRKRRSKCTAVSAAASREAQLSANSSKRDLLPPQECHRSATPDSDSCSSRSITPNSYNNNITPNSYNNNHSRSSRHCVTPRIVYRNCSMTELSRPNTPRGMTRRGKTRKSWR